MKLGRFEIDNIYNEDCYKAIKDIPDNSIDLIITDPPYQIDHLTGAGMLKEKRITDMMESLETNNLNVGIKEEIFDEWLRVLKKPNLYIWCNKTLVPKLIDFFVLKKELCFEIIAWSKTNAMPLCGGKYLTDTEYCLYFHKGVKLNTAYGTASTHYVTQINIADKKRFMHPTIKPFAIISNFIKNSSNENDVVLDCFVGSGTIPVAAKDLGRHYIGFDNKKKWCEIAKDRLSNVDAHGQINFILS